MNAITTKITTEILKRYTDASNTFVRQVYNG